MRLSSFSPQNNYFQQFFEEAKKLKFFHDKKNPSVDVLHKIGWKKERND